MSDDISRHMSDKISIDHKTYVDNIGRLSQTLPVLTCKVLHELVLVDQLLSFSQDGHKGNGSKWSLARFRYCLSWKLENVYHHCMSTTVTLCNIYITGFRVKRFLKLQTIKYVKIRSTDTVLPQSREEKDKDKHLHDMLHKYSSGEISR